MFSTNSVDYCLSVRVIIILSVGNIPFINSWSISVVSLCHYTVCESVCTCVCFIVCHTNIQPIPKYLSSYQRIATFLIQHTELKQILQFHRVCQTDGAKQSENLSRTEGSSSVICIGFLFTETVEIRLYLSRSSCERIECVLSKVFRLGGLHRRWINDSTSYM